MAGCPVKLWVGDTIRVFNHWREEEVKGKQGKEGRGADGRKSRIKKKFSFIVLLENGRSVDYAEVAMQRR